MLHAMAFSANLNYGAVADFTGAHWSESMGEAGHSVAALNAYISVSTQHRSFRVVSLVLLRKILQEPPLEVCFLL